MLKKLISATAIAGALGFSALGLGAGVANAVTAPQVVPGTGNLAPIPDDHGHGHGHWGGDDWGGGDWQGGNWGWSGSDWGGPGWGWGQPCGGVGPVWGCL
jgi:hypothetical protein